MLDLATLAELYGKYRDVAALPVTDGRTPEDIIGYDAAGLPS